jgi:excisionase family DNA binding protein
MDFDRESRSRRRLILLSRPQTSVPSDPTVPNPPIDPSKTAEIEAPIPAAAGGDTGDTDIQDDQSLNEPNIGLIGETFPSPQNIWRCGDCGRNFDSRSAWRLHTLNRSCVEVRESPAKSAGSENQKARRRIAMESNMESKLLNVKDASRFLAVSISTLYGWVWQRRIPYIKVGRALRFDRRDLEMFIRSNRVDARSEMK